MSETIVFTSGKGGVGKTTCLANIGIGLSLLDKKVLMIDTDIGLRNLDVVMGMENQINYNIFDLLQKKCVIRQAVIKDKRFEHLYIIPGSLRLFSLTQYRSSFITLIQKLKQEYDYILIDCPAGIDEGFRFSTSVCDHAIIVTTPQISAIRDAGRTIYELECNNNKRIHLLINEYDNKLAKKHQILSKTDIEDLLEIEAFGVVPYDSTVISSQNRGEPYLLMNSKAYNTYMRICKRIIEFVPLSDNNGGEVTYVAL